MKKELILNKYWLYFISVIFLGGGYLLWQVWPSFIISSMQWQKDINEQLIALLYEAQTQLIASGLSLISLAFIYGILHSLGPGHGKLIVTTYLATHPTKIKISLILTVLSALLQAVVAIVLVSVLLFFFNSSMREVNDEASNIISLSFYSVILLGGLILWRNIPVFVKTLYVRKPAIKVTAIKPAVLKITALKPLKHDHQHSHNCGCGHVHFADADVINNASSMKEYIAIIFSVGLRPCTGAIMVLLFSNMLDMYWLGIISAFFMSIGTALTTSTIAVMTIMGSKLVQGYMNINNVNKNKQTTNNTKKAVHTFIKVIVGMILVLMGVILLQSQPVTMFPAF